MFVRRETNADIEAIDAVHAAAFSGGKAGSEPAEVGLVRALRADSGWRAELSLVAECPGVGVIGHVVCSLGLVGEVQALGLGPLGVLPDHQGRAVGSALMHTVLGAADAAGYPVVVLLGHVGYYPRFGFVAARSIGVSPPQPSWGDAFQARPLSSWSPSIKGTFRYAAPFDAL